ncbi:1151_t:CDS:2 [Gigaspora rosea]|nr:1151_t:CDS:2 [Gigaspora rosea]
MSEKSLSVIELENHSFFHTYVVSPVQAFFRSHVVWPSKEYSLIFSSYMLILLSILLLLILLLGKITGKSSNQNHLDIPIPSIPTPSIPNVPSSVEPAVSAVSSAVTDAANTAANTAGDIAALLSAFDNFKPRSPTANVSGFFTIPYLIALIFNVISLPLLYFHFTIIAALLILTSSLLNFIACFFDLLLFVWVFDLISIIPGIGSQNTGPGIYLATMSVSFLTVATILLCIGSCSTVRSSSNDYENEEQSIFD